jgi:uracil-DNA glycosylase family 4
MGGTRTGRAFTGDKSGDFLFKCLHKAKISNQPHSISLNDGLKLKSTYITNILKCVPPGDKPNNQELYNCSKYFDSEIFNLKNLRTIVALGKVAFDSCEKFYKKKYNLKKKIKFIHGKIYSLPGKISLVACYHPSPRNVNRKLISEKMIVNLFLKSKKNFYSKVNYLFSQFKDSTSLHAKILLFVLFLKDSRNEDGDNT